MCERERARDKETDRQRKREREKERKENKRPREQRIFPGEERTDSLSMIELATLGVTFL